MKKYSVLIVDDISENIDVLKGVLQDDYIIKVATNGVTALKIAQTSNPPDLILLDIMMPEMDGYEVCKHLKENPETKNIPIIFVTAKDKIEDEAKGLELGAADYIIKPVQPMLVKARVKTHMQFNLQKKELQKEKELNDFELSIAEKIQKHFIPEKAPSNSHFNIKMVVKQKRAIGGDFIDFFSDTDGSVGIVLADVSGHGIPAALITAMLKVYTLNLNTNINISQFLTMINNSLSQIIEGQFVAILLGILNSNESSFVFSNAGQCYPLLYKKEQDKIFKLIAEGSAIGVFQGIELKNPQKLILRKGDLLFLYTDGVTEGISQNAAEGEKILFSEIQRLKNEPLNIIVDNIFSSLKKETNNNSFLDDLSLIGVSVK